jgi:hypothetical protein
MFLYFKNIYFIQKSYFYYYQGKEYINYSGNTVKEKLFKVIDKCCGKKCYIKISDDIQKNQFDNFWEIADYDLQNYILNGLTNVKISNNNNIKHWEYFVSDSGIKFKVCKIFFVNLLQIDKTRIDVLHKKIIKGIFIHYISDF